MADNMEPGLTVASKTMPLARIGRLIDAVHLLNRGLFALKWDFEDWDSSEQIMANMDALQCIEADEIWPELLTLIGQIEEMIKTGAIPEGDHGGVEIKAGWAG